MEGGRAPRRETAGNCSPRALHAHRAPYPRAYISHNAPRDERLPSAPGPAPAAAPPWCAGHPGPPASAAGGNAKEGAAALQALKPDATPCQQLLSGATRLPGSDP